MIMYGELALYMCTAMAVLVMALMSASLYIAFYSVIIRMNKKHCFPSVLTAAFSVLMLQGMSDIEMADLNGNMSFLGGVIFKMPAAVVMGIIIVLALAETALFIYMRKIKRSLITPGTIKESLDFMPDGVCFSTMEGLPILVNEKMSRLSGEIFGRGIMDTCYFWEELKNGNVSNRVKILRSGDTVSIKTSDERVWDFRKNTINVNGNDVSEFFAYDVTEQYRLNRELNERNRRLNSIGNRLKALSLDIERVTREKEILTAKARVHDEVGRALLALRLYIAHSADSRDRKGLVTQWNGITLGMAYGSETKNDAIEDVLSDAEKLSVVVVPRGELPENDEQRALLLMAARECVSNTAKHAQGKHLFISVKNVNNGIKAKFTNDGISPVGRIRETGGLKNLRQAVEKYGGKMTISAEDRFTVTLELPEEGKND